MSYLPEVKTTRKKQFVQQDFKGLNRNAFIADNELYDMKNMSSRHYPYASPRAPRGVYKDSQGNFFNREIIGLCEKDGKIFFCTKSFSEGAGWFWYKNSSGVYDISNVSVTDAPKQFVSVGSYLLIFPDKKWFNPYFYDHFNETEEWWQQRGMEKPTAFYGNLEAEDQFDYIRISLCNVYGEEYKITHIGAEPYYYKKGEKISIEENGNIWLDTSSYPSKLMEYSEAYRGWLEITSTYIKVSVPGSLANFYGYDGVKLNGFPDGLNDFNGSHVLYAVESDSNESFFVISGVLDFSKDYGANSFFLLNEHSIYYITKDYYLEKQEYEIQYTTNISLYGGVTILILQREGTTPTIISRQTIPAADTTEAEEIEAALAEKIAAIPYTEITQDTNRFKIKCVPTFDYSSEDGATVSSVYYKAKLYTDNTEQRELVIDFDVEIDVSKLFSTPSSLPDDHLLTEQNKVSISRTMPNMDYVCELNGRLWGCSNEFHEIYASAPSFPFNFNTFLGLASDSYAVTVGTDGEFTGCATYLGYVLFFKENLVHEMYGTKPSNYQLSTHYIRGVQRGCSRSLCVLNETLFYKSKTGIMAFAGTDPEIISEKLGDVAYSDAVAGVCGGKYYVSMKRKNGSSYTYDLLVFDTQTGFWHKEDNTQFKTALSTMSELYFADANNHLCTVTGSGADMTIKTPSSDITTLYSVESEGNIDWSMESGDLYFGSIDNKYISRLRVLFNIFKDTTINVYLRYDNDANWTHIISKQYKYASSDKNTHNLPIVSRRSRRLRIKITGTGDCDIQAIAMDIEQGSEI